MIRKKPGRNQLNRTDAIKENFTDKGVKVLNMEELMSAHIFNSMTYVHVQCKDNPEHSYKYCLSVMKRNNIEGDDCPHCKNEQKYAALGIPLSFFQDYATKNNLTIENKQDFYKRYDSFIAFICNSCGHRYEVKELNYFERKTSHKLHNCEGCQDLLKPKAVIKEAKTKVEPPNYQEMLALVEPNRLSFIQFLIEVSDEGYSIRQNDTLTIPGTTLDIAVIGSDSKVIAFEYCKDFINNTELYYQNKLDVCADKGIKLITIFDDEWTSKKDICKSRIRNLFGKTENKIAGRNCGIVKIPNETALAFCEENHIQGKGKTFHSYGLYNNNELVSVMTFSNPSISKGGDKKDYDWELNRFCSKLNTVVMGGANKLIAAFRDEFPNDTIITFCDLRWGTGKVYEEMGFQLVHRTRPNYYYVGKHTDWKRKHRFGFTKQNLIEIFKETDNSLTEKEIAEKNGLFRMYDCGHLKFILNPKK